MHKLRLLDPATWGGEATEDPLHRARQDGLLEDGNSGKGGGNNGGDGGGGGGVGFGGGGGGVDPDAPMSPGEPSLPRLLTHALRGAEATVQEWDRMVGVIIRTKAYVFIHLSVYLCHFKYLRNYC